MIEFTNETWLKEKYPEVFELFNANKHSTDELVGTCVYNCMIDALIEKHDAFTVAHNFILSYMQAKENYYE